MPEHRYQLVLSTCPDRETAERIAAILVEQRLAACVNIVPGLTSVYRWQGRIEKDPELLLLIKTEADRFEALARTLRDHHPYELPEVVAVTLSNGSADYLNWITTTLNEAP